MLKGGAAGMSPMGEMTIITVTMTGAILVDVLVLGVILSADVVLVVAAAPLDNVLAAVAMVRLDLPVPPDSASALQ